MSFAISVLESGLLQLHSHSTWLMIIPASAIVTKSLVSLPFQILQYKANQRHVSIKPILSAYHNTFEFLLRKSPPNKIKDLRLEYRQSIRGLWKKYKCHPMRSFAPLLIQIPLFLSMSFAIRRISGFPLPFFDNSDLSIAEGLNSEGMAWFTDLSMSDPTLIGPIALGTMHLMNYQLNAAMRDRLPKYKRLSQFFGISLSLLMIPISTQVPFALCLYWLTSAGFQLCTNLALYYHKYS